MHPQLAKLRKYILKKPVARQDDHSFRILDGFLDDFAHFERPRKPVILLRVKDATLEEIRKESKSCAVDERRAESWETATKDWEWVNVFLDGSWSEQTLIKLIDESYDITVDSLEPSQRERYDRFRQKKARAVTVKLDLATDFTKIGKMVADAVGKYAQKHRNRRTAKRHPVVTRLDLDFSLGDTVSTPWVHLHFDTKPGGEPDGDPTHPDFARLNRRNWLPAVKAVCEDELVAVTMPDGREKKCNGDRLNECIGKLLVAVLLEARRSGLFDQLPKAERCELGVEDPTTGAFGWPAYEQRGKKNLV